MKLVKVTTTTDKKIEVTPHEAEMLQKLGKVKEKKTSGQTKEKKPTVKAPEKVESEKDDKTITKENIKSGN